MPLPRFRPSREKSRGLKSKFVIIESLLFVIPLFVLCYIFYQKKIALDATHLFLVAMIILLILAGLILLRHVFEGIISMGEYLTKASVDGAVVAVDIRRDVAVLEEISDSFVDHMRRVEQLSEELSQRAFELQSLKEMTEIASKILNVEDLLSSILDMAMALKRARIGSVVMVDHESGQFRIVAARGLENIDKDAFINVNDSLLRYVIAERKPLLVRDIEDDPRTKKHNDPRYGAPSFLSMPIVVANQVEAVLTLANKERGELFNEQDKEVLAIMLGKIGFALENAILHSRVEQHVTELEEQNVRLETEISERKKTEEELRKTLVKLQEAKDMVVQSEKLAAIGQLTAGVAHEILNPVNILSMKLQILSMSEALPENAREPLKDCEDEIARIVEITKNLGQFSRTGTKDGDMTDINGVVHTILNLLVPRLLFENVVATTFLAPEIPLVRSDKTGIEQVLLNVCSNAVDAMQGCEKKILTVNHGT